MYDFFCIKKGGDKVVRNLSTIINMYIINIRKENVTVFHHENGQDMMKNFVVSQVHICF